LIYNGGSIIFRRLVPASSPRSAPFKPPMLSTVNISQKIKDQEDKEEENNARDDAIS